MGKFSISPTLSIIIPAKNQATITAACLTALLASPPDVPFELLIVDDASDPPLAQTLSSFITRFASLAFLRNETNRGFAVSCNNGARAAQGCYLLFLNNDTEVCPDWWQPLIAVLEDEPDVGIVAPKLIFPDGTIQHCGKVWSDLTTPNAHPHHIYYRFPADHPAVNKSRTYMMVTGACILLRAADFHAVGGFDERFENGWEDDDLCYAITSTGKQIFYCAESVVIHHQNKTLNERMDELRNQFPAPERLRELDMIIERGSASPEQIRFAGQVQTNLHSMEAELLRLQEKFHRNRTIFFNKWGSVIMRDDFIYCQEDGVLLEKALIDVVSLDLKPPREVTPRQINIQVKGNEMPLISIIILTRNRLDVTRECIASIQRHTPESHEIIFIDNGSTDGTALWLRELIDAQANYRLIENGNNLGFAAGCNQGMRAARGNFILLLNNDVVVTPEWLSGMLECFNDDSVGIVGPMTNNISGVQRWPWLTYQKMEDLDAFSREFRHTNRYRRIPTRRIVGFCMMFRRTLMDRIGLLDEQFGSGNFEDDDYCLRAALEEFQNLVAADVFIHHVGSATFKGNNVDYSEALTRNQELFNRKWSKPVADKQMAQKVVRLKTLEKAELLHQRGFADKAVTILLSEGIHQVPDEPSFYHHLARIFLEAEMPADALSVLEKCPEEKCVITRILQGQAFFEQGNEEEAMRCVQELSDNGTTGKIDALVMQANVLLATRDLHGAGRIFEQARAQAPFHAQIYAGLADVAHLEGDENLATELLERAFCLDPSNTITAKRYHASIASQKQLDGAERCLAEARHFYPDSDTLAYIHIDILLRLKRYQDAMKLIEHAFMTYKWRDGFLNAAQSVRDKLGPLTITTEKKRKGTSVSLCMIVKDEEKNLPRCLASLKPVVDEMIVVDTGSTDQTREVATIFGAHVIPIAWEGDFSAARNISLREAGGNWILVMDADEVISPQDYQVIRELVSTSAGQNVAYIVTSRNYTNRVDLEKWRANRCEYPREEMGRGWMPSDKARLFPNRAEIIFENTIHEMVEPSLTKLGVPSIQAPFVVHHYGYLDNDRQQRKLEHYYELGKRKMAETGGSPTAIVELAIQAAAVKKYDEAMTLWKRALEIDPNSPLAYFNLGHVYLQLGMFREGSDAAKRAMELKKNYREAQVNYLLCQLCLGNIDTTIEATEQFLTENPDYPILLLMQGVLSAASGDREKAAHEFAELREAQVEFSNFIHEVTAKLIQGGQRKFADNLVAIAESVGCCKEETVQLVS